MKKIIIESIIYGALFYIVTASGLISLRDLPFLTPLSVAVLFAILYIGYSLYRSKKLAAREKEMKQSE